MIGGTTFVMRAADVEAFVKGNASTAVTWHSGPPLRDPSGGTLGTIADFAFDGNGNIYVLNTLGRVLKMDNVAGAVTSTSISTTQINASREGALPAGTSNAGTLYRGLAFASTAAGNILYASQGHQGSTTVRAIDWTGSLNEKPLTGPPAIPTSGLPTTTGSVSDLASCALPTTSTSVTGPAFKVQKTVINPDGSIQPVNGVDGSRPGVTRTMNADGTVTIDYLVTVTNVGSAIGNQPIINDTLTLPPGFITSAGDVVLRDSSGNVITATKGVSTSGTPPVTTVTFAIPNTSGTTTLQLDPSGASTTNPISRTYKVSVKSSIPKNSDGSPNWNSTSVDWTKAGTCNTGTTTNSSAPGPGVASAGGFFNVVAFPGGTTDQDGPNNNDACAPVSSAQLKLVKQIVSPTGQLITSTDSKFFRLTATGPTSIAGNSPTSGTDAVASRVVPGTYLLHEQGDLTVAGNNTGQVSGLYTQYAGWVCTNNGAPKTITDNSITLVNGDNVTCIVKNTKEPLFRIKKTSGPTDP